MIQTQSNYIFEQVITPATLEELVVLTLIHFKSTWKQPFHMARTRPEMFLNPQNSRPIHMMTQTEDSNHMYGSDTLFEILEMEYADDVFSMGFILTPNLLPIDLDQVQIARSHLTPHLMSRVTIPRFEHRTRLNLLPMIKQLGVSTLTTNANMSRMIMDPEPLVLRSAIHECFIQVDEVGTQAAAYTMLGMSCEKAGVCFGSKSFRADRPFTYYILHKPTQTIVFSGFFS